MKIFCLIQINEIFQQKISSNKINKFYIGKYKLHCKNFNEPIQKGFTVELWIEVSWFKWWDNITLLCMLWANFLIAYVDQFLVLWLVK